MTIKKQKTIVPPAPTPNVHAPAGAKRLTEEPTPLVCAACGNEKDNGAPCAVCGN